MNSNAIDEVTDMFYLQTFLVLFLLAPMAIQTSNEKKKGPPIYVSTTLHQWPANWPPFVVKHGAADKGGLGQPGLVKPGTPIDTLINKADTPKHEDKHNKYIIKIN